MHFEIGYIHIDVAWDVGREALDFNFTHYMVKDAAGGLDADGNAHQLDAHADAKSLVQSNALEVDVDQHVLDGLALPIDDHGLGRRLAGDFDIENCVVAGL